MIGRRAGPDEEVPTLLGVHAAVLDAKDLTEDDVGAWRSLADRAVEPNPFFRPEFVLASAAHHPGTVELRVVVDGEDWAACMPVRRTAEWQPVHLPTLHPWCPTFSLYAAPLVDRDAVEPALDAFVAGVAAEPRAVMLIFDQIDPGGAVVTALRAAAKRHGLTPIVFRDFERAAWRRRPGGEPPPEAISRSSSTKLRQQGRQLARHVGGELEVVDRSAEPAAWQRFVDVERSGWKGERGTALGSSTADSAFFRAMCDGMHRVGRLQLLALEGGGETLAMESHLIEGELLYSFRIGFDGRFGDFSPGTQLQSLVLERFGAQGIDLADSCAAPGHPAMNRMWPDRRRMQVLFLPTRAPRARLLRPRLAAEELARRGRDRVRGLDLRAVADVRRRRGL